MDPEVVSSRSFVYTGCRHLPPQVYFGDCDEFVLLSSRKFFHKEMDTRGLSFDTAGVLFPDNQISLSLYRLLTRGCLYQILRKASRIRSSARHMVEHLGALTWLSDAAVARNESEAGVHNHHEPLDIPLMSLEVLIFLDLCSRI